MKTQYSDLTTQANINQCVCVSLWVFSGTDTWFFFRPWPLSLFYYDLVLGVGREGTGAGFRLRML